jgi:SAM-dependent methyltransferase
MYYRNKIESLQNIFGTEDLELKPDALRVGAQEFPIRNDVIDVKGAAPRPQVAEDIRYTFGAEWKAHGQILPEHAQEFAQYFDLVDLPSLKDARVGDLGCGSGRWSYFLKDRCRELVLVDFSDAIYVARENLRGTDHCLFLKADLMRLPLADDFADFILCLGVLHHLPIPCLDAVRNLKKFAATQLIFLYYALDNRPIHFRILLKGVTAARLVLARIRSPFLRKIISFLGTVLVYLPLVSLGRLVRPLGLSRYIPLYEFYRDKSLRRIQQDVYDRFFTRIEQRVTRKQILELQNDFAEVRISDHLPYWHFLLRRQSGLGLKR